MFGPGTSTSGHFRLGQESRFDRWLDPSNFRVGPEPRFSTYEEVDSEEEREEEGVNGRTMDTSPTETDRTQRSSDARASGTQRFEEDSREHVFREEITRLRGSEPTENSEECP